MTTTLKFRTVTGKKYELDVDPNIKISEVKDQLAQQYNELESRALKLLLNTKTLTDDTVVSSLNIQPNSYIILYQPKVKKPQTSSTTTQPQQPNKPSHLDQPIQPQQFERESPTPHIEESTPTIQEPDYFEEIRETERESLPQAEEERGSHSRYQDEFPTFKQLKQQESLTRSQLAKSNNSDPINFSDLVSQIVDMGFDKPSAEKALRKSNYELSTAIEYLLSGNHENISSSHKDHSHVVTHYYGGSIISSQEEEFNPSTENFTIYDVPNQTTIHVAYNRYGQLQSTYDDLTNEEKQIVDKLAASIDPPTVLQVFIACDKNEETTKLCLDSMN
ncbi:UBA/TS-N domain containing protein [Histomonas meleagridis]|uniref:UBA/TS-N domain containing protein n=1 Tax=Histomonas meleagridis TaxID=135588 RepID=UPI00355A4B9F|nr:UBA/TS-N domain containing protein [Histomonas meleagridis]KAH0796914.1 UBA/TS-N domain containing protein [Histomonas meleagridis]